MRARHVFLALLIIFCGLLINADRKGTFARIEARWQRQFADWPEIPPAIRQSELFAGDWQEVKRSQQALAPQGAERLVIDNPYGHVFVTGKSQKEINLETVKWGRATNSEARLRNSDLARLEISRAGRDLKLTVTGPPDYSRKAQIDLYLTLPQYFSLRGESIIGTFHIENLKGDIKADTINTKIEIIGGNKIAAGSVNGDIEISNANGPVSLENKNGNLVLHQVTGAIEASNIGGGISAYDVSGAIDFSTISGQIYLERLGGKTASLGTTSGEIAAGVAGHYAGRLKAENVSGPIRLILPTDISCKIKADTVSGAINNPFALADSTVKRGLLKGTFGGGEGEISASTVSGYISLENDANYPSPSD
jgi:hypothetical protein